MSERSAIIGKFALDSLTIGMYENEKVIFREYIQNSTDAIDQAIHIGLLKSREEAKIEVIIEKEAKKIKVIDNGPGIDSSKAYSKLCDIGNSEKDYLRDRGFRGIGRLAGTAYCEKLIFITSAYGENKKSKIIWDCKKLKKLLEPTSYRDYDLQKVIQESVGIEELEEKNESHYFEVILEGVENDELLDVKKAEDYISQVAPVEMDSRDFYYYTDLKIGIKKFMKENNIPIEEYPIELNTKRIKKLYSQAIKDKNNKKIDDIVGIEKKIIKDENGVNLAFLWYGNRRENNSQIYDKRISGIRYRKNNILVGDGNTVSKLFKESRFNKYYIGEIYILNSNIIPNARRDDFEENFYYKVLKEKLEFIAKELSQIARVYSEKNNLKKKIIKTEKELYRDIEKKEVEKLGKLEKKELDTKIKQQEEELKKNRNKYKRTIEKLGELGRKVEIEPYNKDYDKKSEVLKCKETIEKESRQTKLDPLKGISRDISKVTRGILKIIKNTVSEKEYDIIEKEVYEFVQKKKR